MTFQSANASSRARTSHQSKNFRYMELAKPQVLFDTPPSNFEITFKPLLTSKPHAVVSLQDSLRVIHDAEGNEQYQHPYKAEIEQYSYPDFVFQESEPIMYLPFSETTATFVDTPEGVDQMLAELKQEKIIAIDLEHHDYRTYSGLLSLMQISSRTKDWIVDTLKPWRGYLECLNEVFTDPSILKVFHGAMMDIIWLQRDLGLYIVGLFDTGHAARALTYPAASLAYLLQRFVNFDAQKQYQMSDWRIRPLPQEMFDYARSDTHFLLYIYDCIRNELLSAPPVVPLDGTSGEPQSRISIVSQKSKETSLQTFNFQAYDYNTGQGSGGWYRTLIRSPVVFSPEQFEVFRSLHAWRDRIARKEDEGIHYVMPNHVIFSLAKALPTEKVGVLTSYPHPNPLFRSHLDEVLEVIKEARAKGANGPSMSQVLEEIAQKFRIPNKAADAVGMSMGETVKMLKLGAYKPDLDLVNAGAPVGASAAPLPSSCLPSFGWGDAQALQKLNPAHRMKLRSSSSTFWGKVLAIPEFLPFVDGQPSSTLAASFGSINKQSDSIVSLPDVTLPVPLPQLTALIFDQDGSQPLAIPVSDSGSENKVRPVHEFVPASERNVTVPDEVFVVRQLGMKKRSGNGNNKEPSASNSTSAADLSNGDRGDESGDVVMSDPDCSVSSSSSSSQSENVEMSDSLESERNLAASARRASNDSISGASEDGNSSFVSSSAAPSSPSSSASSPAVSSKAKAGRKELTKTSRPEPKTTKKVKEKKKERSKEKAKSQEAGTAVSQKQVKKQKGAGAKSAPAVPFDYTSAPSVLNSSTPDATGQSRRAGGSKKKADPYARAMGGLKAERKRQREGMGKSGTFSK